MSGLNFRVGMSKDAEAIANLINSAYRGESSKVGWTTEADLVDGLRIDTHGVEDLIKETGSQIIIALDQNEVVGCVHVKKYSEDTLFFGLLAISPNSQSQGTGKKLLKEVDEQAIRWNLKKIRLTVINLRLDLIPFYERRGFRLTGKSEPFPLPHLTKVPGIILLEMIKDLN